MPEVFLLSGSGNPPMVRFSLVRHAETAAILPGAVARRWLAVELPYSSATAVSSTTDLPRVPLDAIRSDMRAAAIDGFLPGEAGYPLVESVVVSIEGTISKALRDWFDRLPDLTDEKPLVLGAVGDMIVNRSYQDAFIAAGKKTEFLLGDTLPLLRSRDILVGNLEGPVSLRGKPNPVKRYQFRHDPSLLAAIVDAGFDHVTFANNHTLDYGQEAFSDTLRYLRQAKLSWTGAGNNLQEAAQAVFKDVKGERISFLSFAGYPVESRGYSPQDAAAGPSSPGILVDPRLLRSRIGEEAASGRTVVVIAHAGFEYITSPHESIRTLYRSFIDAGASLVLGGHPHVLQGIEPWGRGVIAYSLGNFLFLGLNEDPPAQKSGIFSFVVYKGAVRGFSFAPVVAGNDKTRLDPAVSKATAYFFSLCQALASEN